MFHSVVRGEIKKFTITHDGCTFSLTVWRARDLITGRERIDAAVRPEPVPGEAPPKFLDLGPEEYQGKLWHRVDHGGSTLRFRAEIEPERALRKKDFRFQITIDAPRDWVISFGDSVPA